MPSRGALVPRDLEAIGRARASLGIELRLNEQRLRRTNHSLERCRAEHLALRRLIAHMPAAHPFSENDVVAALKRLRRVLLSHLDHEDTALYPLLESAPNAVLSRKAARYREHMGGIANVFTDLCTEWMEPGAITARPDVFLDRWLALLGALHMRMDSEDEDLYAMAEQVFSSVSS